MWRRARHPVALTPLLLYAWRQAPGAGPLDFEEAARLQSVLKRIDTMARTGWYRNCHEIADELRSSPDSLLVRTYFDDEVFCAHLNALCDEARRQAIGDGS